MRLRVLWVDDEAKFGDRQTRSNWPEIMRDLLDQESLPGDDGSFYVPSSAPASFAEILFASFFSAGVKVTQRFPFDIANLDMLLKSRGEKYQFADEYLRKRGLLLLQTSRPELV